MEGTSRRIRVLVVDDERPVCDTLRAYFERRNGRQPDYEFDVDTEQTVAGCVGRLRTTPYDVLILDLVFEPDRGRERREGLDVALLAGIQAELGWDGPIRIVVTGYPRHEDCVRIMRTGAWDYITKEDVGDRSFFDIVVDSALARLRELDFRKSLERKISSEWLPAHYHELGEQFGGKIVALWHEPEIKVIASGEDVFALNEELGSWPASHAEWEKPYLLRISTHQPDEQET